MQRLWLNLNGTPILLYGFQLMSGTKNNYRFILPNAQLRFAGGRENGLRDLQDLTTSGRTVAEDIQMILDMGLEV